MVFEEEDWEEWEEEDEEEEDCNERIIPEREASRNPRREKRKAKEQRIIERYKKP